MQVSLHFIGVGKRENERLEEERGVRKYEVAARKRWGMGEELRPLKLIFCFLQDRKHDVLCNGRVLDGSF